MYTVRGGATPPGYFDDRTESRVDGESCADKESKDEIRRA